MSKLSILTAYAVPLINVEFDDSDALNSELRKAFLEYAAQGDTWANKEPFVQRNASLFESAFNLFDWNDPAIAKLRDQCMAALYRAVGELNQYDDATLARLHVAHESWFHVTRKGGYFGAHNHPLHSWSGVYCVCQEGDEDNEHSGRLTFISPYATNTMFVDMASHKLKPPFHTGSWPIRLKPGQLLLFPSWLLHQVTAFEPANDDGLRITVAFNARFRMEGVEPLTAMPNPR
ncbi:putative 2OG-Fe(II) oxygenase [Denitratimonas sp. CY0512]|uniref:putative 2OG-Fe(II) oxygenase n=1 Tax=Denitratimonas sp. CY0512 TaxID=3131940 RepID=UPI0030B2303C